LLFFAQADLNPPEKAHCLTAERGFDIEATIV
jgi:hypothetical protein